MRQIYVCFGAKANLPQPQTANDSKTTPVPRAKAPRASGPEKWPGQGARAKTVRMYGEPKQRSHGHFLRPAALARRSKQYDH
jgi:hypothetical protein